MALIVSEQMQQRKKLKFQRELKRHLSSFTSDQLKTNIQKMFKPSVTKPSADAFYNMILATKFGTGNAINNGGQSFMLECCVEAYNHSIENKIPTLNPWGGYGNLIDEKSLWSNGYYYIEIDEKLFPHCHKLDATDFLWANEISPYLFLDKATQAYGFVLVPLPAMKLDEFKEWGTIEGIGGINGNQVEQDIKNKGYARYSFLDFDTGSMEYLSAVKVQFGTVDKLIQSLPDRDRHNVVSHNRKLSSGKTTKIKAHKRKTPLRLVSSSGALTDHVVYSVKDWESNVRYIGEGKRDRPKHVNSGASHNWKINEHFFTKGEMTVERLHEGLTKSESLAIEKMLIKQHTNSELWNVRDYEPFVRENERLMTIQDIEDCFDL